MGRSSFTQLKRGPCVLRIGVSPMLTTLKKKTKNNSGSIHTNPSPYPPPPMTERSHSCIPIIYFVYIYTPHRGPPRSLLKTLPHACPCDALLHRPTQRVIQWERLQREGLRGHVPPRAQEIVAVQTRTRQNELQGPRMVADGNTPARVYILRIGYTGSH